MCATHWKVGRTASNRTLKLLAPKRITDLPLPSLVDPQSEMNRLTRQFWVTKEHVKADKYGLSASRYCHAKADAAHNEKLSVTLERLRRLEGVMLDEIEELKKTV
jgi:hypothetical protein